MRRFFLAALALALACTAGASALADETRQIEVGGVTRSYLLHLPAGLPPHPALILAFHGGGGTARGMARLTGFDGVADAEGFIVAYPQGLQRHWNDGRATIKNKADDVGFIAALIAKLTAQYGADPARIYATGISNGAIFTNLLGCRLSGRLAAIAPVAGSLAADAAPACAPARPLSVLLMAGTADPIVPFNGGNVRSFGGLGEGGAVIGAPATARFWARADGCGGFSAPQFPPPARTNDPTRLERLSATACPEGTAVQLIEIQGAGHVWPGGPQYLPRLIIGPGSWQIDASTAIANFFLAHPAR